MYCQWESYGVFSLVENHVIKTLGSPLASLIRKKSSLQQKFTIH